MANRIRDLPERFHTCVHLKFVTLVELMMQGGLPRTSIKIVTWIHCYLWNWPWNRLRDLYWLPTTFLDWVAGFRCHDCDAPLNIWGDCTGLENIRKNRPPLKLKRLL